MIAHAAVQQDRGGQLQLVEDFEQAPIADAIAIVAPGEVARRLLTAADGIHADSRAEREVLDIERDIEGKPLATRPGVAAPEHRPGRHPGAADAGGGRGPARELGGAGLAGAGRAAIDGAPEPGRLVQRQRPAAQFPVRAEVA